MPASDEEIVTQLARAIREEQVRQYRDDERGNCPGGASFYEENVGPYQIALAALKSLKEQQGGGTLAGSLRRAARNVELARERASVGYLAGWEHQVMTEAAIAIEAAAAGETTKIGSTEGESAGLKGIARLIAQHQVRSSR